MNKKTESSNTQLESLKKERQKLNEATRNLEAKLTEFRAQKQLVKPINEATIALNSQSKELNNLTNLLNQQGLQPNLTTRENYNYIKARNKHSKALFQHEKALREHKKTCRAYEQNKPSAEKLDDFFLRILSILKTAKIIEKNMRDSLKHFFYIPKTR